MERCWLAAGLGLLGLSGCGDSTVGAPVVEVARVEVSPLEAWIHVGDTLMLKAVPVGADGVEMVLPIQWSLAGGEEGMLTPRGSEALLVARRSGAVRVTATARGRSGSGMVVVQPPAPAAHCVKRTPQGPSVEEGT